MVISSVPSPIKSLNPARSTGPSQRQLRVGEEIRHALVRILAEESFRDPALQDVSITVSEVRPGPDLKTAKAFVCPLGGTTGGMAAGNTTDDVVAGLNRAAGFLRGRLGRMIHLKFTPQLTFVADRSFDTASAINTVLQDRRVAQDLAGDPGRDADDSADGPADRPANDGA